MSKKARKARRILKNTFGQSLSNLLEIDALLLKVVENLIKGTRVVKIGSKRPFDTYSSHHDSTSLFYKNLSSVLQKPYANREQHIMAVFGNQETFLHCEDIR